MSVKVVNVPSKREYGGHVTCVRESYPLKQGIAMSFVFYRVFRCSYKACISNMNVKERYRKMCCSLY